MNFLSLIPYLLIALLILLLMVTIHEFGHYTAGRILKFKINEFAVGFGPVVGIPKFWDKEAMEKIRRYKAQKKREDDAALARANAADEAEKKRRAEEKARKERGETALAEEKKVSAAAVDPKDKELLEMFAPSVEPKKIEAVDLGEKITLKEYNRCYLFRLQRKNKRGELISLRWFPLGGFCAFNGEDSAVAGNDSFNAQKPWKRLIVQFAGAFFNIVSAIIFSMIFLAVVGFYVPQVAKLYGQHNEGVLQENDVILAVEGNQIDALNNYSEVFSVMKVGNRYNLTIVRDGEEMLVNILYDKYTYVDDDGKTVDATGLGIEVRGVNQKMGFFETIGTAFPFTYKLGVSIIKMFGQLFTGQVKLTDLGGPISTISEMGKLAQADWQNIFILLPLLAVNLGVFNLFPIPSLDGSRMLFSIIEWIRRKPINRNVEAMIHFVGLVALFGFVILVDLLHFL